MSWNEEGKEGKVRRKDEEGMRRERKVKWGMTEKGLAAERKRRAEKGTGTQGPRTFSPERKVPCDTGSRRHKVPACKVPEHKVPDTKGTQHPWNQGPCVRSWFQVSDFFMAATQGPRFWSFSHGNVLSLLLHMVLVFRINMYSFAATQGPRFWSFPYANVLLWLWHKVPNLEVCLLKMSFCYGDTSSPILKFSQWKCPFIAAVAQIHASHCFHAVVASI